MSSLFIDGSLIIIGAQHPPEAANKPGRAWCTKIGYSCKFREDYPR